VHCARNLMSGKGIAAVTGDDDANKAGGVSLDTPHTSLIPKDFGALEHVFAAAESSCAEALLPHALPEIRQHPNQPHWETAILKGLAMPKLAGTWCLEPGLDLTPSGSNVIGSGGAFKLNMDSKRIYLNGILTCCVALFMQDPPGL
jgi:hypothetical protein